MKTSILTLNVLTALLLSAGAVQAAEPQAAAPQRPLDLTMPHDAKALQAWHKKQALERHKHKPYGSGYESRGLGERNNGAANALPTPSNPMDGNGQAGGGGSGGRAGAGGGSGGSGGRGR